MTTMAAVWRPRALALRWHRQPTDRQAESDRPNGNLTHFFALPAVYPMLLRHWRWGPAAHRSFLVIQLQPSRGNSTIHLGFFGNSSLLLAPCARKATVHRVRVNIRGINKRPPFRSSLLPANIPCVWTRTCSVCWQHLPQRFPKKIHNYVAKKNGTEKMMVHKRINTLASC